MPWVCGCTTVRSPFLQRLGLPWAMMKKLDIGIVNARGKKPTAEELKEMEGTNMKVQAFLKEMKSFHAGVLKVESSCRKGTSSSRRAPRHHHCEAIIRFSSKDPGAQRVLEELRSLERRLVDETILMRTEALDVHVDSWVKEDALKAEIETGDAPEQEAVKQDNNQEQKRLENLNRKKQNHEEEQKATNNRQKSSKRQASSSRGGFSTLHTGNSSRASSSRAMSSIRHSVTDSSRTSRSLKAGRREKKTLHMKVNFKIALLKADERNWEKKTGSIQKWMK
uniref:Uncharacterized protein n=1 Tax=Chromera velia CCMP2878 TaxID=1169474 RepID=A0A0G4HBP4_9ALVE|eukprot:Cvel_26006.t1-p1 / transcript=Cvel_26006.t1 / gene=Cvel_26006 / organism=Chromera_velia_CCMP2878 / gene_product=hypothetical protein / transcript_product=hypothetical protein / location=Cvel_scaffold3026:15119-20171(-) / protein_length=279 / sequence_SO=supercontig / SO=protein_coding / is_pseudo=false